MKEVKIKFTGYNIDGNYVTRMLEKGESVCNDRCVICNSLLVENYFDAPYRNTRCAICGRMERDENFNKKSEIKNIIHDLAEAEVQVCYLTNMLNTLQETNGVRQANGNM